MKVIGYTDSVNTCECCGKTNLKSTVVLQSGEGVLHYGRDCAAKAAGHSGPAVRKQGELLADRGKFIQKIRDYAAAGHSIEKVWSWATSFGRPVSRKGNEIRVFESYKADSDYISITFTPFHAHLISL